MDDEGFTPLAAHVPSGAVGSGLGGVLPLVPEVQECGEVVVHPEDDAATMTAVAPVRAAGGHIFFPVEGHGPIAASAAAHGDAYLIYKHFHGKILLGESGFKGKGCFSE